jgi:hypothetical protein
MTPDPQKQLLTAIREAAELSLEACPEYRSARRARESADPDQIGKAWERLRITIESWKQTESLKAWFDEQRTALLKENLDSDQITESLAKASRFLERRELSLPSLMACNSRLETSKKQLLEAIEQRRELITNVEKVRALLDSLETSNTRHKHELRYLSTSMARIEGQLLHGYTPDREKLSKLREELEAIAKDNQDHVSPEEDHLRRSTRAFLDRYESKLSLAQSRELREELEHATSSVEPLARWTFWNKLRELEMEHSTKWTLPNLPKSKAGKANAAQVSEVWDVLTDLLSVADSERSQKLRDKLASTFDLSEKKQKKEMKQLKNELSKLLPVEDKTSGTT